MFIMIFMHTLFNSCTEPKNTLNNYRGPAQSGIHAVISSKSGYALVTRLVNPYENELYLFSLMDISIVRSYKGE